MRLKTLQECELALRAFVPPPRSQRQKYNLRHIRAFMEATGNPQNSYQVVHVAGTSGKTSTCYYLASLFTNAGLKTGLTVSPHITKVTERVQINLQPASDEDFAQELSVFLDLVQEVGIELTYFEVLIAFAYWYFAQMKVDVAVIETGLGGLMDGSNVVHNSAKVCVLTDIGLDHTAVLGDTIPQIAAQKAGIIGEQNEAFTWKQPRNVLSVFRNAAKMQRSELHILEREVPALPDTLPLFQKHNLSLAVEVASWTMLHRFSRELPQQAVLGAAHQSIPARMEQVERGGRRIVLDGAHNPQKMHALVESYKAMFPSSQPAILFSCIEGPDSKIEQSVAELLTLRPSRVVITAFQSLQDIKKISVEPEKLQQVFKAAGYTATEIIKRPDDGLEALLKTEDDILVTGSLYLIFDVRSTVLS